MALMTVTAFITLYLKIMLWMVALALFPYHPDFTPNPCNLQTQLRGPD